MSEHTVVLLVDMQEKFVERLSSVVRERIIKNQQHILCACAHHDIPVANICLKSCGTTIAPLAATIATVARRVDIIKSSADAFSLTTLNRHLREWSARRLLIMGINTSACVLRTAGGALHRDYSVYSANDLIGDGTHFSRTESWWALYRLRRNIHLEKTTDDLCVKLNI